MNDLTRSNVRYNTLHNLNRNDAAVSVGSIVTAIPAGRNWRIKAIGRDGETVLLGRFDGRLAALGACVLLAKQCSGVAVP